jgi:nucleotide-binding universal stress UspA family protein
MVKILLAVDGSENAIRATRELVAALPLYAEMPAIELVNVHPPLPYVGGLSGIVVSKDMVECYYKEEGEKALAPSARVLDEAGAKYTGRLLVGDIPRTIVQHAHEAGCTMIYMGTRGMNAVANLMLGSVTTKVLHLADVPVVLVR